MNKRQKLVQQAFLNNEGEIIKRLEKTYGEALTDIEKKAKKLQDDIEELDKLAKLSISDEEKEVLLSRKRAKVYQKQYQESLKKQVNEILDKMHKEEFKTVSEYLDKCYEEGFVGTMFDLQGQGIPLIMPIDQESMVRAIQIDSKISKGLYSRLGEDVSKLKKMIASDVSRGISTGMTFKQIAGQLKAKTNIGYNNAVRIARTEGHRIQCQAGMDACYKAKEKGADVVKQWDATLDSNTRESHSQVDGEIRELDEKFSNGLMFPGDPSGGAAEVINCRCALLQRARKALDEPFTKMNNETGEIVDFSNIEDYQKFKETYLKKLEEGNDFDITENGKYKVLPYTNEADYRNHIRSEYQAQKQTQDENFAIWAADGGYIQNADGYKDINGYMRGVKDSLDNPKCQKTIDVLTKLTSTNELKKDYVGFRKVSPSYLQDVLGIDTTGKLASVGLPWEKFKDEKSANALADAINALVGTDKAKVKDAAFTSISLCENINFFTHRPLKFEIQMPSGTKGLITDNIKESEFIAKPNSTLDILGAKVYNDNGNVSITIFSRLVQD